MPTLIPHGITPTGFGIRQRARNGSFRPISPCCGTHLRNEGGNCFCNGCNKDYTKTVAEQQCSLGNDVGGINLGDGAKGIVVDWFRNVTGIPDLEVKFK
jgi:hypothetical protein